MRFCLMMVKLFTAIVNNFCPSCETKITSQINNHSKENAPNRSREKQENQNYRMGQGFSHMLKLLNFDIRNKEGVEYAKKNNLFTEICPKMVESAASIVEEIIKEN